MHQKLLEGALLVLGMIFLGLGALQVSRVQAENAPLLWMDPAISELDEIGATAEITFTAFDIEGFNGIDLIVIYDPSILEVVLNGSSQPVTAGDCPPADSFFVENTVNAGQIDYAGTLLGGSGPSYCSNGLGQETTIGSVTFSCLVADGSTTTVSYVDPILALVGTDVTPSTIQNATISCGTAPNPTKHRIFFPITIR